MDHYTHDFGSISQERHFLFFGLFDFADQSAFGHTYRWLPDHEAKVACKSATIWMSKSLAVHHVEVWLRFQFSYAQNRWLYLSEGEQSWDVGDKRLARCSLLFHKAEIGRAHV
jgi:hypothetical protein